jgi:hypothetical protein
MDRETKSFKTALDKDCVIYTYLTGRERRAIRNIYTKGMEATLGDNPVAKITGEHSAEAEDTLLKTVVVSYDGSAENIVERLLAAQDIELSSVVDEINKTTNRFTPAK